MNQAHCLLLRLEGPLQSWGYRSRFSDRDTGTEPTKSGLIGLLCCALGRDRTEPLDDLVGLRMFVRVDQEGRLLRDFHTAGAGVFRGTDTYAAPKSDGSKGKSAILMEKHYLQDASFLVAVEGPQELLQTLESALIDPAWPLSLGRRSCPPASPVVVGLRAMGAEEALRAEPYTGRVEKDMNVVSLRVVSEAAPGTFVGEARNDVPIAWPDRQTRHYATRYVTQMRIEVPAR